MWKDTQMRIKGKLSSSAAILGLLALPVVSLFGSSLTANAATALPAVKDGKITLQKGETYDGSTIPAGTELVGNGATINGKVTLGGDKIKIDNVNFQGNGSDFAIYANNDAQNVTISNVNFKGYGGKHTIELVGHKNYSGLTIDNVTDDNHPNNNVTIVAGAGTSNVTIKNSHLVQPCVSKVIWRV